MRVRHTTVVLVMAALLSAACGSRVPVKVLEARDQVGTRTADGNGAALASDQDPLTTGEDGTAAGLDPGTSSASDGGAGTSTAGATKVGAPAPAGGNGGATAQGVTADTITVGSIGTMSGPLPGATAGSVRGVQSYFAYVNSQGGVYGRRLKVIEGDDGLDAKKGRSEFLRIEPKAFVFVGGLSVADSGYVDLVKERKTPYVGGGVSEAMRDLPTYRDSGATAPKGKINISSARYWQQAYPKAKRVGFISPAVGGVRANVPNAIEAFKAAGYEIAFQAEAQATDPDYTALVISAQSAQVELLYLYAFEINMMVRFVKSMKQQQWEPMLKLSNIAYGNRFYELLGRDGDGWHEARAHLPFLDPNETKNEPGLARFVEWNKKLYPDEQIDFFPVGGWISAQYFVEGLKQAGPNLTRAKLLAAIDSVPSFDGSGIVPSWKRMSPTMKDGEPCFVVVIAKEGRWQREKPADRGFHCPPAEWVPEAKT